MYFKVSKGKAQCICQLTEQNRLILRFLYYSVEIFDYSRST